MRLLIVSSKFGFFGGVERYIYNSCLLLKRAGYRLYGLFEERSENSEPFEQLFDGYTIVRGGDLGKALARASGWGCRTALLHKCEDPELLSTLLEQYRLIVTVHDHDYYCPRRHKYFPLGRVNCTLPYNIIYCSICSFADKKRGHFSPILRLLKGADRFIVLSDYMRDNLLLNGFAAGKVVKVNPFIEPPLQLECGGKAARGEVKLLYVGQLIRGKGCDLMLKALPLIKGEVTLTIVGKGNDLDYLRELTARLELKDRVCFSAGYMKDIGRSYCESDLIIFPSRWQEPFGLVGIEAMNYGKPVVAFDVGGVGEWLKDGENGLLAEPGSVESLAAAIECLIKDPGLRERLGQKGRELVEERFRESRTLAALQEIIEERNDLDYEKKN